MLKRVSKKARRSRIFKRIFLSILIIFPFVMASLEFIYLHDYQGTAGRPFPEGLSPEHNDEDLR